MCADRLTHAGAGSCVYSRKACSIVIPTHNRPDLLPRSVRSALHAIPQQGEVVVVDDRSYPPAELSLKGIVDERLRVVRNPGSGGAADARNHGCSVSRGEVMFFLDDDDEMVADYVAHVLSVAGHRQDIAWGFCATRLLETGKEASVAGRRRLTTGLVPVNAKPRDRVAATSEGFWIRRLLLNELGGFDVRQRVDEDTDLCVRLMALRRQPWYVEVPGVVVHRGYVPAMTEGAQLTKSTAMAVSAQCYRRTCEKNMDLFPVFSPERWYLCTRFLRRAVKANLVQEAATFARQQQPWPWSVALRVYVRIKRMAHG